MRGCVTTTSISSVDIQSNELDRGSQVLKVNYQTMEQKSF